VTRSRSFVLRERRLLSSPWLFTCSVSSPHLRRRRALSETLSSSHHLRSRPSPPPTFSPAEGARVRRLLQTEEAVRSGGPPQVSRSLAGVPLPGRFQLALATRGCSAALLGEGTAVHALKPDLGIAEGFVIGGSSRWSTPWRPSSRTPPVSASGPAPTLSSPPSTRPHPSSPPTSARSFASPSTSDFVVILPVSWLLNLVLCY
jgi:hypothetical protein